MTQMENNFASQLGSSLPFYLIKFVKYGGIRSAVCPLCMICRGMLLFLFQSGAVLFLYGPALRQEDGRHIGLHIMSKLYVMSRLYAGM